MRQEIGWSGIGVAATLLLATAFATPRAAAQTTTAAAAPATAPGAANAALDYRVHLRFREKGGDGSWGATQRIETWDPKRTALIVCDMWDSHHSQRAAERTAEVAPRMNQLLESARGRGSFIIHAPSDCMAAYAESPARKRAQNVPPAKEFPKDIAAWCTKIPAEEAVVYPIDQSDGGEDDAPEALAKWHAQLAAAGRNPKRPWKKQIDSLRIDEERDAVSDSGKEIWSLLEDRKIEQVLLMGVHTNMCVLGRPFGLRQLAKNGRKVALVRDLTDTMYNPARWPYVDHFVGTDLIVEHIEKVVCPTIESVDLLGGRAFRFAEDRRRVLFIIGEDEYKTETTLPIFASQDLEPAGFECNFVKADPKEPNRFPKLAEAIPPADLLFVSVRRRLLEPAQLAAIRAHLSAGKPLVGIRTANHAFAGKGPDVASGKANDSNQWRTFDADVFGGSYTNHYKVGPTSALSLAGPVGDHPILTGINPAEWVGQGSLYKVRPLAKTTAPLLLGSIPDQEPEPVAWTNECRVGDKPARIFYTSLGHPKDFDAPQFRRLLKQGISWALDVGVPAPPAAKQP